MPGLVYLAGAMILAAYVYGEIDEWMEKRKNARDNGRSKVKQNIR